MGDSAEEIRRSLVEVIDELNAVPSEDIAGRARLRAKREELGARLRAVEAAGLVGAQDRWAQSASKKTPSDGSKPHIPSHIEGASGGI